MKIAVDLGNRYFKAISETGQRVLFRSVIAEGKRRSVFSFSKTKSNVTDTLQVSFEEGESSRDYYVGKMAERFGTLPEYVFGKERFDTESAERLVMTALAVLNPNDEPIDLVIDFPYGQFAYVKDTFTARLRGKTQRVDVQGYPTRHVTIRSVAAYPQGLVAAYDLASMYPDVFASDDGYLAVVDIGGDTTDVVVLELIGRELVIHEELSGTLTHGTRDMTQVVRRSFEAQTGDILDADLADRVVEYGSVFYGNREWNFSEDVERGKRNLSALLKSQISDLWGVRKNRIRTVFWVGGGASLLESEIKGFHFEEVFAQDAQWANAKGCLVAVKDPLDSPTTSVEKSAGNPRLVQTSPTEAQAAVTSESLQPQTSSAESSRAGLLTKESQQRSESTGNRPQERTRDKPGPSTQSNVPRRFQEGQGAW